MIKRLPQVVQPQRTRPGERAQGRAVRQCVPHKRALRMNVQPDPVDCQRLGCSRYVTKQRFDAIRIGSPRLDHAEPESLLGRRVCENARPLENVDLLGARPIAEEVDGVRDPTVRRDSPEIRQVVPLADDLVPDPGNARA